MIPIPRTTLTRLFLDAADRFGDAAAFGRIRPSLDVEEFSYREVVERAREVVGGLDALALGRGDRAGILSENRLEWGLADLGCLCAGVVDVPIYTSLEPSQIAYILRDSLAKVVFVSTRELMEKAVKARAECDHDLTIVVFDPPEALPEGVLSWASFLRAGADRPATPEEFRRRALEAAPDDLATILYTSGTTGEPKGVMLTHGNISSNVLAVGMRLVLSPDDVTVSFLPLCHIFQRTVDYFFLAHGCTVVHGRSIATAMEDMKLVRPTVVGAVPRLYEKMYHAMVQARGYRKNLLAWAMSVAEKSADLRLAGKDPGGLLGLQYRLADRLVFAKIRAAVGGRVRWFISGSAPLSPQLNRFFYSVGLTILEGYGLTETSPVLNINTPEELRVGTVGKALPGTELRIAADGEILARGPQIMKGYYNRPEETAQAIDPEGWFSTGDIGEIDADGFLRITDRKKDLLKTSGGKYVAPAVVENRLKQCVFVEQSVIVGDGRKYVSLLVVPAFPSLEGWARERRITWTIRAELISNTVVVRHMETEVRKHFHGLAAYETPKKIALLQEEFTVVNGFLTPSLKVKRRVVHDRYKELIDSLYGGASD